MSGWIVDHQNAALFAINPKRAMISKCKSNVVGDVQRFACRGGYGSDGLIGSDCGHLLAIRPARECVFMCLLCLVVGRRGQRESGCTQDRKQKTILIT